jgi:hypothetical protein
MAGQHHLAVIRTEGPERHHGHSGERGPDFLNLRLSEGLGTQYNGINEAGREDPP